MDTIEFGFGNLPEIVLHLKREPVLRSLTERPSETLGDVWRYADALRQKPVEFGTWQPQR